jgi:hypothetical protein
MSDNPSLQEEGNLALGLAQSKLPGGWRISLELDPPSRFVLHFEHELAGVFSASLKAGGGESNLSRILGKREFLIVGQAPSETPHAALLLSLRQYARGYDWSEDTMSSVSQVLALHDVLTEAEAKWLEQAGPAWLD